MTEKKATLQERLQQALEMRGKRAADLSKDLNIPKSAISQYLNKQDHNMNSDRLAKIADYLNVSEPWLLGYTVPMERGDTKRNDIISDAVLKLRMDDDFFRVVSMIMSLRKEKLVALRNLLVTFSQDSQDQV